MSGDTAWIFANGELKKPTLLGLMIQPGDLLVAADGGLAHLLALGLKPHILIGDLDSVDPTSLQAMQAAGVDVRRHPVHKNETDLELALELALRNGRRRVRIVAATGGRLDHTLGNLYLLAAPHLAAVDIRLESGDEEIFLIRERGEISGAAGDLVSLLPLTPAVEGVLTSGLQYPLIKETLFAHHTRGISNVMEGVRATVTIDGGILICIHIRL